MSEATTSWRTLTRRFVRLGLLGFGGPNAHIAVMRRQWVESGDLDAREFADAFSTVSLLPGPASTQLALWIGWREKRVRGMLLAALCFITPSVAFVLALSVVLLHRGRAPWLSALALGAAAAVPAVAVRAACEIGRGYFAERAHLARRIRIVTYAAIGAATCLLAASWLPLGLLSCGAIELVLVRTSGQSPRSHLVVLAMGVAKSSLAWTALKVGALSFGGGFVIVPMMRGDAVTTHHWTTASMFATAVAIGQITPGPVVATVAAVGYAAGGVADGIFASAIAFAPSLLFIGAGASHFDRVRQRPDVRRFLDGAGPAAAGAIVGAAVLLARACTHSWQWPLIVVAALIVTTSRRLTIWSIVVCAVLGLLVHTFFHLALG